MTYVYELIENFENLLECAFGDYNFGSENDLSTYDIGKIVLESLGISNRVNDILICDEEIFKDKPRDLRIYNDKLKSYGVTFSNTKEAIKRCVYEFK